MESMTLTAIEDVIAEYENGNITEESALATIRDIIQ